MSLLQRGCHCVYSSSGKSIYLFWFSLSMLIVKTVNKWYYIVTTDVYDGFLIRYFVSCITESSIIVKEPGESIALRCSWSKAMMNMLTYICSRRVKQESLLWRISQKESNDYVFKVIKSTAASQQSSQTTQSLLSSINEYYWFPAVLPLFFLYWMPLEIQPSQKSVPSTGVELGVFCVLRKCVKDWQIKC